MVYGGTRMALPADRRFVFVTGKGGVGKTTVTAALALALASHGKRVLIAMCNAKERVSALMGSPPVGSDIAQVAENVWAVNIDPENAVEEYGLMILRSRGLYKVVFDNKYVRSFFSAVPGLHEWAMLGKAWFHTTEVDESGRSRFDVVLLDAPATGHGLDMLRVPKVILDVVPPGLLRREAERAWAMLQDPALAAVVVVTLPEELPATETIELVATIRGELNLPVGEIVVNGVLPPLFTEAERAALVSADVSPNGSPPERAVAAAARRAVRERVQAESLQKLGALEYPKVYLPFLFEDAARPEAIRALSKRFV